MINFFIHKHNHIHGLETPKRWWWCLRYKCQVCKKTLPEKCFILERKLRRLPRSLGIVCSDICAEIYILKHQND